MFYLILWLSKTLNFIINFLRLGAGYTWPGHVALNLNPHIAKDKHFKFPMGVALVTGTNGKTTTSKLLTHILETSGLKVTHNGTGANLLNGIVSAVLLDMDWRGGHDSDIAVFEVDENNLPVVLEYFSPNVLVLLNLSRDQLDRYGEVDIILEKWLSAIDTMDPSAELVLDSTQKYFKKLPEVFEGDITYFDGDSTYLKQTSLVGEFNAKNVNAAVYTAQLVGIGDESILKALKTFNFAYGRGETLKYSGKSWRILLAKNPASFNNNLDIILSGEVGADTLVFVFNDKIPDGRDVSWIYDIEAERLQKACEEKNIYVTGTRGLDMAVRLKYAGVEIKKENIFETIEEAVRKVGLNGSAKDILALPNYSAMLQLRKVLTGKAIL